MFILILKFTLAFILTMIPFVFHYWFKPTTKGSQKWENSISFLENSLPSLTRRKRQIYAWLMRIYRKMKFSRNARKFFIYILAASMLLVQVVDFQASKYVTAQLLESGSNNFHTGTVLYDLFLYGASRELLLSSHVTPFVVHLGCLVVTICTFSFKFTDSILTYIHNSKWASWTISGAAMIVIVASFGQFSIACQLAYLIVLAGLVYPNPSFEEYGKWHKRITRSKQRKSVATVPDSKRQKSA